MLHKFPCPALSWIGVTNDSKYVIGLSEIMLDNPFQLVVYDSNGHLLAKQHITPEVACLTHDDYLTLYSSYSQKFDALSDRIWIDSNTVYVDFMSMDMPRRLGKLWDDLIDYKCNSPFSSSFSESVTNWVFWFDVSNPDPKVIEENNQPVGLRLLDRNGETFYIPFYLESPFDKHE